METVVTVLNVVQGIVGVVIVLGAPTGALTTEMIALMLGANIFTSVVVARLDASREPWREIVEGLFEILGVIWILTNPGLFVVSRSAWWVGLAPALFNLGGVIGWVITYLLIPALGWIADVFDWLTGSKLG